MAPPKSKAADARAMQLRDYNKKEHWSTPATRRLDAVARKSALVRPWRQRAYDPEQQDYIWRTLQTLFRWRRKIEEKKALRKIQALMDAGKLDEARMELRMAGW
jgi:hypothetical protein